MVFRTHRLVDEMLNYHVVSNDKDSRYRMAGIHVVALEVMVSWKVLVHQAFGLHNPDWLVDLIVVMTVIQIY